MWGLVPGWLLALLVPALAAGATPTPADDVQDLLFLGGPHPVLIRLHVRVSDRPLHAAWRDAVGKFHAYLDADGDGLLKREEAEGVDWTRLVRVFQGFRPNPTASRLPGLDTGLQDGIVTVDELAEFLRAIRGPLLLQVQPPGQAEKDPTFVHLDTNGDGVLDRDEIGRAADVFRTLDQNDDEMISVAELTPFRNPFIAFSASSPDNRATPEPPVVLLGPNESRTRLVQRLLKRFDTKGPEGPGKPDRRLSAEEIGLDPDDLTPFDGDGDGSLDGDELMQFLEQRGPAVELIVRLGPRPANQPAIEVLGEDAGRSAALPRGARIRTSQGTRATLMLGDVWLELRFEDRSAEFASTRQLLLEECRRLDKDDDKALTAKEVQNREPLQSLFPFIDRNRDGKFDEKELGAALDVLDQLAKGHSALEVADRGSSLFKSLDASGEGRLSRRELRSTGEVLASFDRDGDRKLSAGEIPHRFEGSISQGPFATQSRNRGGNRAPAPSQAGPAANGPTWFRKMDRNHDGDLSPREFLGPTAEFQRLDADGDGLIDAREANAENRPGAEAEGEAPMP
jgi:Ca2+-binding EF-hand superfamily protein